MKKITLDVLCALGRTNKELAHARDEALKPACCVFRNGRPLAIVQLTERERVFQLLQMVGVLFAPDALCLIVDAVYRAADTEEEARATRHGDMRRDREAGDINVQDAILATRAERLASGSVQHTAMLLPYSVVGGELVWGEPIKRPTPDDDGGALVDAINLAFENSTIFGGGPLPTEVAGAMITNVFGVPCMVTAEEMQ